MHLPRHRFRETLQGKLARVVIGMAGERTQPGQRRDIEDQPAATTFGLTHDLDGAHRHAGSAEEERLHLLVGLFFRRALRVTRERIPRIVDDDVEAVVRTEVLRGGSEGGVHGGDTGHVQGDLEDVGVVVREVGQAGRVAGGCD